MGPDGPSGRSTVASRGDETASFHENIEFGYRELGLAEGQSVLASAATPEL